MANLTWQSTGCLFLLPWSVRMVLWNTIADTACIQHRAWWRIRRK